jgi:DNA-binding XRE family transcriptional regulator
MGLKRVKNQNKRFVFLNRSLFQSKHVFLFEITIINIMKQQIILPKFNQLLGQMGENIKLTRKRRKLTAVQVSERAGIARSTLYLVEKGDASVSLGAYFNVLRVLGLQNDFLKLAADDEFGRKLQDLELLGK